MTRKGFTMAVYDTIWNAVYTNAMASLNPPAPGFDPVEYERCDRVASEIADEEAAKYSDAESNTVVYDVFGYPVR